ncbi:MAG: hypothetical protein ABF461_07320 [Zymomonas mobilis subsp. pomaceae]|uniref:Lipoprotein n=1 Tax=Zymomonas mobilis subsp. pomaceae (strain ATCC 29192 / DSM 22645 / JCM 10191 / CCUG 17912 / NBRC 13757 / NCIMB 11200 / NRRL B-4491 / Barker I) TaxID=579138 RepID=F8ESX9_ZYMMT|nr:hypothetical protein [Zymomonas mobilis]AEI37883.1 hypothetical protein Zymop_0984 [Zymomonas mobilis subsp. pomaceae ATCC 29192]MDX5949249.1 hypothetical protein [Zymomonas mobilis subsp. pomaceae]GEB89521.1 hypothetical protein ZMO02_11580 [Zymomonas mobilis subsp. pomaceae]
MKKLGIIFAAAGLMAVAACNKPAENTETTNTTDNTVVSVDNGAIDNFASDVSSAAANAAESIDNASTNAADALKNKVGK